MKVNGVTIRKRVWDYNRGEYVNKIVKEVDAEEVGMYRGLFNDVNSSVVGWDKEEVADMFGEFYAEQEANRVCEDRDSDEWRDVMMDERNGLSVEVW